jgi:hypothetical protein
MGLGDVPPADERPGLGSAALAIGLCTVLAFVLTAAAERALGLPAQRRMRKNGRRRLRRNGGPFYLVRVTLEPNGRYTGHVIDAATGTTVYLTAAEVSPFEAKRRADKHRGVLERSRAADERRTARLGPEPPSRTTPTGRTLSLVPPPRPRKRLGATFSLSQGTIVTMAAALLAFAGVDDAPLAPGGIRYGSFIPRSYKSDYLPSMDLAYAPDHAVDGFLDDLFADTGAAAADTVSQTIVGQVPAIVAAVIASPAYQAQVTKIKTEAILGGLLLGALVVGGVWAVVK